MDVKTFNTVMSDYRQRYSDSINESNLRVDDDLIFAVGTVVETLIGRVLADSETTDISAAEARGALMMWQKIYTLSQRHKPQKQKGNND